MAGINLLDQLRGKGKVKVESLSTSAPSATSKFKFTMGSSNSGDDMKLFLRFLLTGAIFYGAYWYGQDYVEKQNQGLQTQLNSLQADFAKESRKKNQMKGIGDEMKGYAQRVQELQTKIRAVTQNELNRSLLVKAMDYVATEMPREIWFDQISASREDKTANTTGIASFSGYALNAQAVSEFIQKLELSVYFPTTSLERMELVNTDANPTSAAGGVKIPPSSRKFQITAKLGE